MHSEGDHQETVNGLQVNLEQIAASLLGSTGRLHMITGGPLLCMGISTFKVL